MSKVKTLLLILSVSALTGCSIRSYPSQAEGFYKAYKGGDSATAIREVSKNADKRATSVDGLLWRLEEGTVKLAGGDFEGSLEAFERAETQLSDYESRASVNARGVGLELVSAVSNPTAISYKGNTYDKIMLNTYKTLAYLRKGDLTAAKVELRRAYQRQKEAAEIYAKEIAKAQRDGKKKGVSYEGALSKSRELRDMDLNYAEIDRSQAYGTFVNPFTVYLDGLIHLANAEDADDLERAQKNFERVMGMVKDRNLVTPELDAVRRRRNREPVKQSVYVVVEHGVAPIKRQVSLNFPIPFRKAPFVSNSFPVLRLQPAPFNSLYSHLPNAERYRLAPLASMDAIIVKEFRKQVPIMVTRIIINGLFRAAAQYQAEKEEELAGLIGAIIYGAVVNRADLRTWLTLPKEFRFTRFERPVTPHFELRSGDGRLKQRVDLPKGDMILVYAKIPARGTVSVQTLKLR
jgi:hypothetical protein